MTRDIGILWENAASSHLQQAGLQPLARNYHCRYGEIDLVMLDKGGSDKRALDKNWRERESLVFVEVRYRGSAGRGDGLASVGQAKRTKLIRTAAVYLQAHPKLNGLACRFDVVACTGTPEAPVFDWIRGAFDAY